MHRCDTNCMAYCIQFTSKTLRAIVNTLETCYHMLTHSKLAIPYFNMFETCYTVPYVVTFETCYTLCQQIRNMLPYVDIFRTCFTSCWPVNIEGLSSLQLTILVDLRYKHQSSINRATCSIATFCDLADQFVCARCISPSFSFKLETYVFPYQLISYHVTVHLQWDSHQFHSLVQRTKPKVSQI